MPSRTLTDYSKRKAVKKLLGGLKVSEEYSWSIHHYCRF